MIHSVFAINGIIAAQHPDEVECLEAILQSQWTPNADYPMYPPKKKIK